MSTGKMPIDAGADTMPLIPVGQRGLTARHLQFIAIGGAIGSGLFLGSAAGIRNAGPALIVAYAIGGLMVFFIVRALGEMALAHRRITTIDALAEDYVHPAFGYLVGWNYWMSWVLVGMVDITAMAIFVKFWFPDLPQWIPALTTLAILYGINMCGVRQFGELEFWLSLVKVITILGMIVAGIFLLSTGTGLSSAHAIGVEYLERWRDSFPPAWRGFWRRCPWPSSPSAAASWWASPPVTRKIRTVPCRAPSTAWLLRILIFYIGSLTVVMALIPWRQIVPTISPFVLVFTRIGLPATAAIINLVLITAVMSSCNSGLYAAARTLRSLALKRHAPSFCARSDSRGVPVIAMTVSAGIMLAGVILNYYVPAKVLEYIISTSAVLLMGTWVGIVVTHLFYRGRSPGVTVRKFPMPLYPFASWIVLAFIAGVAFIMATSLGMFLPIAFTFGFYAVIMIVYFGLNLPAQRAGAAQ